MERKELAGDAWLEVPVHPPPKGDGLDVAGRALKGLDATTVFAAPVPKPEAPVVPKEEPKALDGPLATPPIPVSIISSWRLP